MCRRHRQHGLAEHESLASRITTREKAAISISRCRQMRGATSQERVHPFIAHLSTIDICNADSYQESIFYVYGGLAVELADLNWMGQVEDKKRRIVLASSL